MSKCSGFKNIEVLDPQNHPLYKFTIYKVVYRNVDNEESVEITIYKRYSDFKKLYDKMLNIHLGLHRSNQFPNFVTANYFDRFEKDVIEMRRKSAEDLLKFVCENKHLCNHKLFKDFLNSGVKKPINNENSLLDNSVEELSQGKVLPTPILPTRLSQPKRRSLDLPPPDDLKVSESIRSRSMSSEESSKGEECEYFEQASFVLKEAEKMEEEQKWEIALKKYEKGIEILLNCAKTDKNKSRVVLIRQQVKSYLDKAEQINQTFLQKKDDDDEEALFRLLDQCVVLKSNNTSNEEK